MYRDYAPKGVKFYYIYKALAHPENDGYVRPVSLQERLLHIKEAKRTLGSEITWLADSISNEQLLKLDRWARQEVSKWVCT